MRRTVITDSSGFRTQAGSPYSIGLEFDASKNVKSVVIGTKDGVVLDAFACTNGIFSPVEDSSIEKANEVFGDVKPVFDPDHVRHTSPEQFREEIEQLIEKHQEE